MEAVQIIGVLIISLVFALVLPKKASAHCNTLDGPTAADVEAGREYIESYVNFFKFAEGEEHEHGHSHKILS